MASKVFISFRYADGAELKEALVNKFEELDYTINKSENENRSGMSEETIQNYLYEKLRDTSLTVVLITPQAVHHSRDYQRRVNDWMYDEIKYSLEDRVGNRTNAMIMVYTEDAKSLVIAKEENGVTTISDFDNLARENMFNVKASKKVNPAPTLYDSLEDHYISLISYEKFLANPKKYIDNALAKRNRVSDFDLKKRL
ncbi:molecular chaperone Tir [Weissella confusa]|uniref:TIR domain-containing protein n=1 Tax=Weissella confusa TaxID=1583 RepID=UPI00223AB9EC|nr:TIR domain-containing protein [Weissella confusa]MCT0042170.1 molecular chaperone Tir [Weissella confusa]